MTRPSERQLAAFWARVIKTDSCWLWTGSLDSGGYGSFGAGGKTRRAHRFGYEIEKGPIPTGMVLDHLCRVPSCVNPAHLEVVTSKVNTLRGFGAPARNARATHCKKGHEFSGDNASIRKGKRPGRDCRACQRQRSIRVRAQQLATDPEGYHRKMAEYRRASRRRLARRVSSSTEPWSAPAGRGPSSEGSE